MERVKIKIDDAIYILISMTQKQKNGEEGELSIDHHGNLISYIKVDRSFFGVTAFWDDNIRKWNISASDPMICYPGIKIFV